MWFRRLAANPWYAVARGGGSQPADDSSDAGSDNSRSGLDPCPEDETTVRARAAQAAECGVVGISGSAETVQSEMGCLKLWRGREHRLLLDKDCVCAMIEMHVSTVIILPATSKKYFPECGDGEVPVALRVPKDDTQAKKEKEKNVKVLKYPKYAFFRARAAWRCKHGTVLTVEGQRAALPPSVRRLLRGRDAAARGVPAGTGGAPREGRGGAGDLRGAAAGGAGPARRRAGVHLGWLLLGPDSMPMGCEADEAGEGLAEPLEMLAVRDVRRAPGDAEFPDFVRASIRYRRSAEWKIMNFIVRTTIELVSVYTFMAFLGTQPNTYTAKWFKPWDTYSDDAFVMPGLFQLPQVWRGPGMERIWWRYVYTFFGFLFLKVFIVFLWAHMPVSGSKERVVRHILASWYPVAVCLPFVLYLVYYQGAIVNCMQCSTWHCGVYAVSHQHLKFNRKAFKKAGGCKIKHISELSKFRKFMKTGDKHYDEHEHCVFNNNAIFNALGISLDTSKREGTCDYWRDTEYARDTVILKNADEICGYHFTKNLSLLKYTVTEMDRKRLPLTMFAGSAPVNNDGKCDDGDPFDGPYIYYEPRAGPPVSGSDVPTGAVCVCRSGRGVRDCYRRVEGTVNRCSHFSGVPEQYGSLLQFNGVPSLHGMFLKTFLTLVIPVFALFTVKAWDDIPLSGADKFDFRMQSRMKLDILDFYMFFYHGELHGKQDQSLPMMKFIVPDWTWHDFELYVWCIAWGSAFTWWSLTIFFRIFDTDPDKTPKTWKTMQDILDVMGQSASTLEPESRLDAPYDRAVRKQGAIYEKELQKILKKRMIVDILDEDVDAEEARMLDWKRCIIVFSSPKVKDLTAEDFEDARAAFTLYVANAWPWSARPPADVWKAESWEEYVANAPPHLDKEELTRNLQKVVIKHDDVLVRVRPGSPYFWFDTRYLGWFYYCGYQPRSEYKKLKEDDHRVPPWEREQGYSEVYYNKVKFDFFERNIEFLGALRSLFVDMIFLMSRIAKGLWIGGFSGNISLLLVLKNCVFCVFGLVYLLTCGNTKHTCGAWGISPLELIAKCIERTKIGSAIKLSMLMPMRICIECTSCGFRLSAEDRQGYLVQRLHFLLLKRWKVRAKNRGNHNESATEELDHEIRLFAGQFEEYQDLIEMLETKNIVKMRARIKAKDIIG